MPPSHDPHARKPFRLLALGGAALVDASGAVVAEQRRRLALLALIAAGRGKGVSRDKLVSYLSPESSSDSARHALHQLLYYLRQQAGEDALLGTDALRLNPDVLTSDVVEFQDLLDRGELEAAVGVYRGPFLDGFHINDSSEFEDWAAGERTRLATLNMDALLRLATAAGVRGDHPGAIGWWSRLAGLDPLGGRAALGLIRAYAAAGDIPTALRHAATYESIVRAELGTEPDPELASCVAELRAVRPRSAPEHHVVPPEPLRAFAAAPQRWRSGMGGALGLAVVVAGGVAIFGLTRAPAVLPTPGLVAIMPFTVTAADSAAAWLHEGLVDLLAVRLADARRPGPVDARLAIASWVRAGGSAGGSPPLPALLNAARNLGASQVVVGTVVSSGGELLLSAELVEVSTGRRMARVETHGQADSVLRLVDTLAVRLVSIQGGEDMLRAGVLGATSVPAVRAYLDGRAALRRGEWVQAIAGFERALAFDSTFASAALGLRAASGYYNGLRVLHAESLVWRYKERLGPRERATFLAELGPNYPAWYPLADRLRAWRALTTSDYSNADAWNRLGLAYYHSGARLGIPDAIGEARIALQRAFDLDSTRGVASLQDLLAIAAVTGDSALLERVLGGVTVAQTDTASLAWHRWLRAFTRRDSVSLNAARPGLNHARVDDLTSVWSLTQRAGFDVGDAPYVEAIIVGRTRSFDEQAAVASIQYHLALNRGRPIAAQTAARLLFPEWRPLSRLAVQALSALYDDGDTLAGRAAALALAHEVVRPLSHDAAELRSQRIHVCVSAQWSLAHGDLGPIDGALEKLRTPEPGADGSATSFYESCGALIEAWRAVIEHRPNARLLAERMDSLLLSGTAWHWALPEHRVAAAVWESIGEPARALAAIRRRRPDVTNYLAVDLREEGRLALRADDRAGAVAAWRHYLTLRSDPEVSLRPEAERVRRQVAVLTDRDRPR
jgi:DNA-binding SARP family transcriptional activator/TolB-like protein